MGRTTRWINLIAGGMAVATLLIIASCAFEPSEFVTSTPQLTATETPTPIIVQQVSSPAQASFTATPPPGPSTPEHIDFTIELPPNIGTVQQIIYALPSENGDRIHILEFTMDLPDVNTVDRARWVTYRIDCTGEGSDSLQWGLWHGPPMDCNDWTREPIGHGASNYLFVELPFGIPRVTYTLTITVDAYSP